MRSSDPALIAFLRDSPGFWSADLFSIGVANGTSSPNIPVGTVFNWTSTDAPITLDGTVWQAAGPRLTRSRLSMRNTLEVPELEIDIGADIADLLGGVSVMAFLNNGGFDAARVTLRRAFMPGPAQPAFGAVTLFVGRVSTATAARGAAQLTVKGDSLLLDMKTPRNLYQASCIHTLYDAGCAVLRDRFSWSNRVGTGADVFRIPPAMPLATMGPGVDPAAFAQGSVTFTGGVCSGQSRGVRAVDGGALLLASALDALPAPGDPFTVRYGCDHTAATCAARFNNIANHRAFPYIPVAETSA